MLEHTYTFWVSSLKSSHANRYRPPHPGTGIMNIAKALVGRLWKILTTIETMLPVLLFCVEPQNLKRAEALHCRVLPLRGARLVSWSGVYWRGEPPSPWGLCGVFAVLSTCALKKWALGRPRLRVGGTGVRYSVIPFWQPSGGTVTSNGAAGTPVSTGSSTPGSGESVTRGHMMPGDRRYDSQVGRDSLQVAVAYLPQLSIHDESLGPNGAWSWGKF